MSAPLSISSIIQLMKLAQYLCANDTNKEMFIYGNTYNENLSHILYVERKSLEYSYLTDPSSAATRSRGNYCYSLMGKYGVFAQGVAAGSGIVVTPSTGSGTLIPYSLNVTITVPQAGVQTLQLDSLIGAQQLTEIVLNQNSLQVNTQFTINAVTGTLDFSLYDGYTLQVGDRITGSFVKPL